MPLQISISNVIGGAGAEVILPPIPFTGLLISGTFTGYPTATSNRLFAISNNNNTLNSTWNTNIGTGISNYVWLGEAYNDKVYIGGFFTTYNGISSPYLAVLDRDTGTWVSSGIGSGFNGSVRCFVFQSDGKIIMAGTFTAYNGVSVNRIVRLNSDYTIDATFNIGSGFSSGEVDQMAFDGTNVYCVGTFLDYNGTTRNRFVKIRISDGADVTGTNSGFNNTAFGITLMGNDLYIGGEFNTYNGSGVPSRLAKINKDTLVANTTFNTNMGTGADARVAYGIFNDGTYVYIYGNYSLINGISRNRVARFDANGIINATPNLTFNANVLFGFLSSDKTKYFVSGFFTNVNSNPNYNRFAAIDLSNNTFMNAFQLNIPSGAGAGSVEF